MTSPTLPLNDPEAPASGPDDTPSALFRTRVDERGQERAGETDDVVAEEMPVAMVYNGISHAVMMATPSDLEDFAVGFSLTESILHTPDELYDLSVQRSPAGATVDMTIASERLFALKAQRRNMAGRTGCGLCGTESLDHAIRAIPRIDTPPALSDDAVQTAVRDLKQHQPLQAETGATHAAAWCDLDGAILAVREDVGRHNALDKLVGHWLRQGRSFERGFALISSRGSFEMVQKSAMVGIGGLVAVSAPTGLAIREARKANMTLIGFARPGRHVIYHCGQMSTTDAKQESPT
ncbi:formate dehydrogenase accessory sulfurtransferase FdhD [Marinobacter bohaiensis]|uniref:formate dehydrogenase accessory sulfurtransferase FdhD n=1 Tax=Marinobacter bohaiensis TaxID=2201898 RepID=UPI000DADC394|nr:formate dehydrogenase accessory sulfurtransferase FdhD [Marinobacter bohaiensis]